MGWARSYDEAHKKRLLVVHDNLTQESNVETEEIQR